MRFLGSLLLTISRCLRLLVAFALLSGTASAAPNVIKAPYILWVTETEAILMWETDRVATATVTCTPPGGPDQSLVVSPISVVGKAVFSGLTPNTRYAFAVDSEGKRLGDGAFLTDTREARRFSVGVIGDNQARPDRFLNLNRRMMRHNPDLVLSVGDIMSNGNDAAQWNTEFFSPSRDVLRFAPIYVSIGNHEAASPNFRKFLPYPEIMTGQPVTSRGHYYSYLRSNAAFMAIDIFYGVSPGSAQYNWIKTTLASPAFQNATWRIVHLHAPPYSAGWEGYDGENSVRQYLVPLFEQYGVDAVFSGHTHTYERGIRNGIVYVINGGSGALNETWGRNWPHIVKYGMFSEYSLLTFDGNTMELRCYDDGDKLFDRLVLEKGQARALPGAPVFVRGPKSGRTGTQTVTLKYPEGGTQRFRYRVAIQERRTEDGFWEPTPILYPADQGISLPVDFKATGTYHVMAQALDDQLRASEWVVSDPVTIQ